MKKVLPILALLLFCAIPARAQNSFYSNVAFREISGLPSYPASGAVITVCSYPGSGLPCAPTTGICASPTDLVCSSPNPFNADAFGNFGFWGKPGNYTVTITGANLNSYSFTATIPPTLSGNLTVNGNLTVTGSSTLAAVLATSVTDSGLTPGNCVQAGAAGLLTTTGSACGSSGGSVTTTGSPASGNLTQFSGGTSITNGNLSGDVTTSGTLAATVAKVNGVAYPSSPSTNTVPVVTAANTTSYQGVPNCAGSLTFSTGSSTFGCNASNVAVQVFSSVGVSATSVTNSATTLASRAVTMPASGCPCRAFVSYSLHANFTGITNQAYLASWVSDGTNVMAPVETAQGNGASGARTSLTYGGYSTVTYSNGANITFTLFAQWPAASGPTVGGFPDIGSGPQDNFQIAIVTSN